MNNNANVALSSIVREGKYHGSDSSNSDRRQIEANNASQNSLTVLDKRTLSHGDYTIGWICALEVEMTAARLMLDEEHAQLPRCFADDNCYIFGAINKHNVAIACLPAGVHGKSSAAVVAQNMVSTFPAMEIYLLVGVGGGVPQPWADIRLGDVVVGIPTSEHPAVIQYDYGKSGTNGFEHKGSLNKPRALLLKAVANLRSLHRLQQSHMNEIMEIAINRYPLAREFRYPGLSKDVLWDSNGDAPPIVRNVRSNTAPAVFYGSIASGDQVIKDRSTRDLIAMQHGVLCFEMEAAGLMDELRALVIRGVCDYCDATKTKEFQPYSALAAASYAKELLSVLPVRSFEHRTSTALTSDQSTGHLENVQHRTKIMDALKFEGLESRRMNVKRAHAETCGWLLQQHEYNEWLDRNSTELSLLWIKGKPGVGKSTAMKFLHENATNSQTSQDISIAFFFNARGGEIERSLSGVYRSLLFQLLTSAPDLQRVLDKLDSSQEFTTNTLAELFGEAVQQLEARQLTCCIDALDECPEDQIWELVQLFESFAKIVIEFEVRIRILFSSRHYPNIVIKDAKYLILEALPGHVVDIQNYIEAELRIGSSAQATKIKDRLLQKSAGIFLWVVLVVAILKKTYAKGRIRDISEHLEKIPQGLNELFRDMLSRDADHLPDLLYCLRWLLYSYRPLTRDELYFALSARGQKIESIDLGTDDESNDTITTKQKEDFIRDSSKGLVEFTLSDPPKVQFIHESVREFLLTPGNLANLHVELANVSKEESHRILRDFCQERILYTRTYFHSQDWSHSKKNRAAWKQIPLSTYAVDYVLWHADNAAEGSHLRFLQKFDIDLWSSLFEHSPSASERVVSIAEQGFDVYLGKVKALRLLDAYWSLSVPKLEIVYNLVIWFATCNDLAGCEAMLLAYFKSVSIAEPDFSYLRPLFQLLLDIQLGPSAGMEHLQSLLHVIVCWPYQKSQNKLDQALSVAVCCKRESAFKLLISAGARCHYSDLVTVVSGRVLHSSTRTHLGIYMDESRHHSSRYQSDSTKLLNETLACVTILLEQPSINNNINSAQMTAAIHQAIRWTNLNIVSTLLDASERLPFVHLFYGKAIERAVSYDKADIVQALLDRGANIDSISSDLVKNHAGMICLLKKGFDIDTLDDKGNTVLHTAATSGDVRMLEYLLSQHASPHIKNKEGRTPLHEAAWTNCTSNVLHLLQGGSQIHAKDCSGNTSLHVAAYYGYDDNIKVLLQYGAEAEQTSSFLFWRWR